MSLANVMDESVSPLTWLLGIQINHCRILPLNQGIFWLRSCDKNLNKSEICQTLCYIQLSKCENICLFGHICRMHGYLLLEKKKYLKCQENQK